MRIEEHCEKTRVMLGEGYKEIHNYIDRHFDWVTYEKLCSLTGGDYYPDMESIDIFKHRELEHHREGIELIVEHFSGAYPEEIVRKVAERHIRDDYQGYLPSREDFQRPEFVKKYHR